jgi:hypothetical protein
MLPELPPIEDDREDNGELREGEEKIESNTGDNKADEKPWDRQWTLNNLREDTREWNLAHDYGVSRSPSFTLPF